MARENRFFLLSSDLTGSLPVSVAGRAAATHYADLISRVEASCGREAAELFAEPMLPRGAASPAAAISWYGPFEGRPVDLSSVDAVARKPLADKLGERLRALAPGFDDPDLAPLLLAALNVVAAKDIVAVGGEPMLVNWGYLPQEVGEDPVRRLDHFAGTIGRYAPDLTPRVARALGVAPPPPAAPRPEPAPASTPPRPVETSVLPRRPPPVAPDPGGPRSPLRAALVACAIAAAILLILLLPGVLAYPDLADQAARDDFETDRLRASNHSLEAQLEALRKANGAGVCRAGDNTAPVPGLDGPDKPTPKMDLLPKPPDKAELTPKPNETAKAQNIAELLEKSVVFVFVVEKNGKAASGSGFFISPTQVITNRHVIEDALNDQIIFVASKTLNGARRARVAFRTPPKQKNVGPQPDFAVLELAHPAEVATLKLGPPPAKLSTAYIAGYPGFLVEQDSDERRFIEGLEDAVRDGVSDEALEAKRFNVPSVDLRYGRINNLMTSGGLETPIVVHDMQLAHGNSGGPLIDGCGRVGGVNTLFFAEEQQVGNVALSVEALRKFLSASHVAFTADDAACAAAPAEPTPSPIPAPAPSPP
jgi:hypothetical protein